MSETSQAPAYDAQATPSTRCALCQRNAVLKKSHIIPNAYFRSMKNDEGKLVSFQLEPDAEVRLTQDSWYENLLCGDCEGQFSALEKRWIERMRLVHQAYANGGSDIELPDFEYDSFRTFLLSIFWRPSVSSLTPFETVRLSADENEELRAALHAGSTKAVTKWHILFRKVIDREHGLELDQLLIRPTGTVAGATTRHRFIFGGFVIDFFNVTMTTPDSLVRDASTFVVRSIAMTDVDEIMYAGVSAIDKNERGLADPRIGKKRKA
jgi:hypothetical protein